MSRIGNKPIEMEASLEVVILEGEIKVRSKLKELSFKIHENVSVLVENNQIIVNRKSDSKSAKEQQGLLRSLLNNAVLGLVKPFEKNVILKGIGFKVLKKTSNLLEFSLGYSHLVPFEVNSEVEVDVQAQDKMTIRSYNKQLLGEVCSKILGLKKRDNYKGKGIYFDTDVIKKKPGKSVGK
jgi:large subunit ribosomal protein L6